MKSLVDLTTQTLTTVEDLLVNSSDSGVDRAASSSQATTNTNSVECFGNNNEANCADESITLLSLFLPDSSESSSACSVQLKDSRQLTLKRTQAIPDLHNMDDYSPVTFDSTFHLKSDSDPIEDHSKLDMIEESKVIIPGIKVRAAKLNKLVDILIESFGILKISFLTPFFNIILLN